MLASFVHSGESYSAPTLFWTCLADILRDEVGEDLETFELHEIDLAPAHQMLKTQTCHPPHFETCCSGACDANIAAPGAPGTLTTFATICLTIFSKKKNFTTAGCPLLMIN